MQNLFLNKSKVIRKGQNHSAVMSVWWITAQKNPWTVVQNSMAIYTKSNFRAMYLSPCCPQTILQMYTQLMRSLEAWVKSKSCLM